MDKNKLKTIFMLHILLMAFSLSGVCSKMASKESFLSFRFILFYGLVIAILGIYAIAWQQIIKRLPLTMAYANRAVTVVWGIIWGIIFFGESVTIGKIIGAATVIAGVVIYVTTPEENTNAEIDKENNQ